MGCVPALDAVVLGGRTNGRVASTAEGRPAAAANWEVDFL